MCVQVFQDECTPISTAAQLQVSSAGGIEHQLSSGGHTSNQPAQIPTRNAMSSHPDPCNSELQIIRKKMEEEWAGTIRKAARSVPFEL